MAASLKPSLDTSVPIAVFLADHPSHASSMALFGQCTPASAFCAAHTLAETYATLTRLPVPHRASAGQAALFLDVLCERVRIASLDGREYRDTLKSASESGIVGGAVYDFLIAACAVKVGAGALYTWNRRDDSRFGPAVARIAQHPA
jgi:predicted nucleic acid-binding protein